MIKTNDILGTILDTLQDPQWSEQEYVQRAIDDVDDLLANTPETDSDWREQRLWRAVLVYHLETMK